MLKCFQRFHYISPKKIVVLFFLGITLYSCDPPTPPNENKRKEQALLPVKDNASTDSIKKHVEVVVESAPQKQFVREYNDNARYIAGLKGEEGSDFLKIENNNDWKQYASWENATWNRLGDGQIQKVKAWASAEFAGLNENSKVNGIKSPALFYPFSGADFLYANTLFPDFDQYVMIGLEPVGKVPDIRKIPTDFWENYFLALRVAMDDILTSSFFKTKDMRMDFKIQELKGTLPIMMIFLERTGHRIVTMEPVEINDNGKVVDSRFEKVASHQYGQMNGIRITYEKENTGNTKPTQKTIYYFSIDLSNPSLKAKPQFESFLQDFGQVTTFIKSASYLMHQSNFSEIRSLILKHSDALVQDDSGIPLKYFESNNDNGNWNQFQFYGAYKTPIPMFSKFYQDDLKKKFADTTGIKPLDFRIGYQTLANKSNVMFARKVSK